MIVSPSGGDPLRQPSAANPLRLWSVWAALTAAFFVYSAIHAPVPGAGEPHYLAKARHFHDPRWCANDFFLRSGNAHLVFYATVGGLTRLFPLETAAWIGRGAGCALVAWGWLALLRRVCRCDAAPLAIAAIVLACNAVGSLSGEWLFNGVEGKVFSYGLLFLAWAWLLDRCWIAAGCAAGLAMAFHPVVGGWGVVAGVAATILAPPLQKEGRGVPLGPPLPKGGRGGSVSCDVAAPNAAEPSHPCPSPPQSRGRGVQWVALIALVVFALPGVIPALATLGGKDAFAADYIQVYFRLPHHLVPAMLSPTAAAAYAGLVAVWLALRRFGPRDAAERWFSMCVTVSIAIAAAGLVVGWGSPPDHETAWSALRLKLMKLYPFRLADTLVPMAAAVSIVRIWTNPERATTGVGEGRTRSEGGVQVPAAWQSLALRSGFACGVRRTGPVALTSALFAFAFGWAHRTRWQEPIPPESQAAWHEICDWAAARAPSDALFLTPPINWAFKWYAHRAEYVTFKDCPQDAAGIVEWNRRLNLRHAWWEQERRQAAGISRDALRRLHDATGVTHLVAEKGGAQFAIDPIYENERYAVYRLVDGNSSGAPLRRQGSVTAPSCWLRIWRSTAPGRPRRRPGSRCSRRSRSSRCD